MNKKIGEIIEIEGKKYRCVEGGCCGECAFDFKDADNKLFCAKHAEIIGLCSGNFREDKTRIKFIEVEE